MNKNRFKNLLVDASSIVLAIIAGVLAIKGLEGWGWFLFASILVSSNVNIG